MEYGLNGAIVAHVNLCNFSKNVIACIVMVFLVSCTTTPEKISPIPSSPLLETTDQLIHWYDNSYKSHFDVRGPIRRLVYANSDGSESISEFNRQGRLVSTTVNVDSTKISTQFSYVSGQLQKIQTSLDGELQRQSSYRYNSQGQLQKIELENIVSSKKYNQKIWKVKSNNGLMQGSKIKEVIGLVNYKQFNDDEQLVWSSEGIANNGSFVRYNLLTQDEVVSARVVSDDFGNKQGRGGYIFHYNKSGLLAQLDSMNGNNEERYYSVVYRYSPLGLLEKEVKALAGESLFNREVSEVNTYSYVKIDKKGNWLTRDVTNNYYKWTLRETRELDYFSDH